MSNYAEFSSSTTSYTESTLYNNSQSTEDEPEGPRQPQEDLGNTEFSIQTTEDTNGNTTNITSTMSTSTPVTSLQPTISLANMVRTFCV